MNRKIKTIGKIIMFIMTAIALVSFVFCMKWLYKTFSTNSITLFGNLNGAAVTVKYIIHYLVHIYILLNKKVEVVIISPISDISFFHISLASFTLSLFSVTETSPTLKLFSVLREYRTYL